ncbi:RibD family protein [Alkalinema sp. FACHB-956]|uniref:RibD family protein n=1 Tax=Alkalinema sp. FACHB-956 TaxID=2692768 RepID=UPI0016869B40|nr:RibD family protein [Alkalinema sp. FACHB-956]MBD2329424.1 RibD family protein [Alkalinema sp. FACHB-956]
MKTTVVLAMTADGKIADRDRTAARFGSPQDQRHLQQQVAAADAVLFGAGTLRAYGTTMTVHDPTLQEQRRSQGKAEQPIQMVCSRQATFDLSWRFFSQPIPRWLLTTPQGAIAWQHQPAFERVLVAPERQNPAAPVRSQDGRSWDWSAVFQQLSQEGLDRLAVLGGGDLVGSLFEADLVDELWLTVCPLILGGVTAPSPVAGNGFLANQAPWLELLTVQPVEQEVFLHYRVLRGRLADK